MNWPNRVKKAKYFVKIVAINIGVFLLIVLIVSIGIHIYHSMRTISQKKETETLDRNTIRATYPNYNDYTREEALAIFTGYSEPKTSYLPFVAWRREPFKSKTVIVDAQFRTRRSVNEAFEGSIWFLGGSTMWGTGATDDTTIPSYFAKQSGETVWNLGESGFNSFQELVQLQILLANGLNPKLVVFYDGVNDSVYCNKNSRIMPTHSRYDKYLDYIENFKKNEKLIKKLRKEVEKRDQNYNIVREMRLLIAGIFDFVVKPYYDLYRDRTDKRAIGAQPSTDLSIGTPLRKFQKKNYYKICGDDIARARDAARMTVETWLLAHDLMKSRGIPCFFFLQPCAQIKPNSYQLDYILDSEKQRIVDEADSYTERYRLTKEIWFSECGAHDACEKFYDLSQIFVGEEGPIFIDAFHISPKGNEIVAARINEVLRDWKIRAEGS